MTMDHDGWCPLNASLGQHRKSMVIKICFCGDLTVIISVIIMSLPDIYLNWCLSECRYLNSQHCVGNLLWQECMMMMMAKLVFIHCHTCNPLQRIAYSFLQVINSWVLPVTIGRGNWTWCQMACHFYQYQLHVRHPAIYLFMNFVTCTTWTWFWHHRGHPLISPPLLPSQSGHIRGVVT